MKKIIFTTDFSESADKAMFYALDLALVLKADLHIFHAYQLPHNRADVMMSVMDILKKDAEDGMEETLNKINATNKYESLNITTQVKMGDVASLIVGNLMEEDYDLVILGTTGASGMKKIIGSTASHVIKHSNVPVLTVPLGCKIACTSTEFIGFSLDLVEIKNKAAISFFKDFVKGVNGKVKFVNINKRKRNPDEVMARGQKFIDENFNFNCDLKIVEAEDVPTGIEEFIKNEGINVMTMIDRKDTFFERLFNKSITQQMSYRSNIPLLILKDK